MTASFLNIGWLVNNSRIVNPKTKTQLYEVKLSTFKKEYQCKGINLIGREDYENQTNIEVPLYIKGNIRIRVLKFD